MPLFFCLYSKFFESPYHCFLSYIPSDVDIFTFIERQSELYGVFLVWRNDSWLKKCIQYCLTRLSYSSLTFILWTGLQLASQIFLSRPICFPRNASLRLICPAVADWKKCHPPKEVALFRGMDLLEEMCHGLWGLFCTSYPQWLPVNFPQHSGLQFHVCQHTAMLMLPSMIIRDWNSEIASIPPSNKCLLYKSCCIHDVSS